MNKIIKILTYVIAMVMLISVFSISLASSGAESGKRTYKSSVIPSYMQPGTVIVFVEDDEYIVEKGGLAVEKASPITDYEKDESVISEEPYPPVKGLKVTYADDGYILHVYYPKEYEYLLDRSASRNVVNVNAYTRGKVVLHRWGDHNNEIYYLTESPNKLRGKGRATTFSDRIGERYNILKKGDVATYRYYDNCTHGKSIDLAAKKSNGTSYTKTMKKGIMEPYLMR